MTSDLQFLAPNFAGASANVFVLSETLSEVSLLTDLLIKGVKRPRPVAPTPATLSPSSARKETVMTTARQHDARGSTANSPPTQGSTMQAIMQASYGSDDVPHLASIPTPKFADREVLVKVHAAGLDRGTWHLMTGLPYLARLALGVRKPKNPVPGRDLAGTVVAVGSSVTRFAVGDEVFGIGRGSFAEYTAAREDKLARKPANLTFEQAAVAPLSGLTAIHAVRDAGDVKTGQRVLITGASGGVGTYAVQLARAFGAEVTGVCSAA